MSFVFMYYKLQVTNKTSLCNNVCTSQASCAGNMLRPQRLNNHSGNDSTNNSSTQLIQSQAVENNDFYCSAKYK